MRTFYSVPARRLSVARASMTKESIHVRNYISLGKAIANVPMISIVVVISSMNMLVLGDTSPHGESHSVAVNESGTLNSPHSCIALCHVSPSHHRRPRSEFQQLDFGRHFAIILVCISCGHATTNKVKKNRQAERLIRKIESIPEHFYF
jgi:hypothetical protein